jgi:phosphoribosylformylglycinamidine cyclo-ligase
MSDEYSKRGASATKEDVHQAIAGHDKGLFPGAFCKIVAEPGQSELVTVMHADGAGTKSSVAYLVYAETGDPSVFKGIAQDALVMNLDDLACVGATTGFLVSNTIGRNAHRVKGDAIKAIIDGFEDWVARLSRLGVQLVMTGGETADVGDLVRTVIVDSTVVCRLPRSAVRDFSTVAPGDLIVGLASFGKARYEDEENSGIGSNGLTLARHTILSHEYAERFPESYSETIPRDAVYSGRHRLNDTLPGTNRTVSWGLLSPTRTYVPVIRALLNGPLEKDVHGILHCSGGGQTKCLKFGHALHYVKDALFTPPAIFQAIEASGIPTREMFQTFNMGHRLELYVAPSAAPRVIELAASFGIDAKVVGRIEASPDSKNRVTIAHRGETHTYE